MRRALFIGTPFFDYYRHIIASFRTHGFDVDHYDDRPGENPWVKAAIRLRPRLVDRMVRDHLRRLLEETRATHYDVILIVNGKVLTPEFVEELRQQHPGATTVLYLWDSIALYPRVLTFSGLVDRRYTFDRADAEAHPEFTLLPLFYTHDYRELGAATPPGFEHDIVNVCTAHPNRYELMRTLVPRLEAVGLRVYSYLYLNRLQYAYYRLRSPAFARAKAAEFHFTSLPVGDYLAVLGRSQASLDVNHAAQSGLTMRTIETLGARRKLVTTNTEVTRYRFYDPSRVLLLDPMDPDPVAVAAFLDVPQAPLDPATYQRYGIDCWLAEIITGEELAGESVFLH